VNFAYSEVKELYNDGHGRKPAKIAKKYLGESPITARALSRKYLAN
jgi:hypothetical protein